MLVIEKHFIYIDFTEGLQYSNFYLVIMMVMDMLSKYGNFMVMVYPYTTLNVVYDLIQYDRIYSRFKKSIYLHLPPTSLD
jgi:hypothetical protein